ncbi:hypothetical protein C4K03_2445 [Pseudomonas synxantha]|uniref:Pertussis toxin subunit 1 n=1 Tax=Pseudomonas synxantha TaxID=47883 RepID=A0A3G7U5N1_9PSED|nr:hypothetical protein [Pseudomonas synxantha]AZE54600.1 hypothetical protein C4K03_2445 [Pseudomonas synxantha]
MISRTFFLIVWLLLGGLQPSAAFADADPPKFVWRLDRRPPDVIFPNGFGSWGTNTDVFAHISGNSCVNVPPAERNSAFISTTANNPWAILAVSAWTRQFPGEVMYLYRIRADINFYNGERSLRAYETRYPQAGVTPINYIPSQQANEYIALMQIQTTHIEEAVGYRFDGTETNPDIVVRNPNYVNRNTHAAEEGYVGNEGEADRHNTWAVRLRNMIIGSCAGARSDLRYSAQFGELFRLEAMPLNIYILQME